MEDRERNILEAATRVFLRYGVKRASMGDIAAEAGVARQTLYNSYTNKDDILRGSIRLFGHDAVAAIEAELPLQSSLEGRVSLILNEMAVKPYAILHSSPNAQDLIDGYNAAGRDELEANYVTFQGYLADAFKGHEAALAENGMTPDLLAEILRRAAATFKHQARDEKHLRTLTDGLIALSLSATRAPA